MSQNLRTTTAMRLGSLLLSTALTMQSAANQSPH
jgi:hypothetical protein